MLTRPCILDMHTRVCTDMHSHSHMLIHTRVQTYPLTHAQTYAFTHIRAHTHVHTQIHPLSHMCRHMYSHTRSYTCADTPTHTCTDTRTHTHVQTHALRPCISGGRRGGRPARAPLPPALSDLRPAGKVLEETEHASRLPKGGALPLASESPGPPKPPCVFDTEKGSEGPRGWGGRAIVSRPLPLRLAAEVGSPLPWGLVWVALPAPRKGPHSRIGAAPGTLSLGSGVAPRVPSRPERLRVHGAPLS